MACVYPGPLESQVVLLCRSIRRFAGAHRDAPISVFAPLPVDGRTRARPSSARNVRPLRERRPELPMANKIFACAALEETCEEDVIVFLDSDSLLVNEPTELELGAGHAVALRPVNRNAVASTGPGHPLEPFWTGVYELCGVDPPPFVTAAVGGARIRGFWNSGLFAVRRSAGLMAAWRRNFLTLMDARHVPPGGKINQLEQVALAATLARVPDAVLVLDGRYNFPLPLREDLDEPLRSARLEDLVHVHYFRSFHEPGCVDAFPPDEVAGGSRPSCRSSRSSTPPSRGRPTGCPRSARSTSTDLDLLRRERRELDRLVHGRGQRPRLAEVAVLRAQPRARAVLAVVAAQVGRRQLRQGSRAAAASTERRTVSGSLHSVA